MCPVRVRRNEPVARSQILMVLSPAPLANHLFPGSTAKLRTQPRCPEMTLISFHGGCHSGLGCWKVCGPLVDSAILLFGESFTAGIGFADEPAVVDPGPASSSFCASRAVPAVFCLAASFFPGLLDGCLAAKVAGRVVTLEYSASNRRFIMGSSNTSSSFCRLPLSCSAALVYKLREIMEFWEARALSCSASCGCCGVSIVGGVFWVQLRSLLGGKADGSRSMSYRKGGIGAVELQPRVAQAGLLHSRHNCHLLELQADVGGRCLEHQLVNLHHRSYCCRAGGKLRHSILISISALHQPRFGFK